MDMCLSVAIGFVRRVSWDIICIGMSVCAKYLKELAQGWERTE
jgi:hypothetical protein